MEARICTYYFVDVAYGVCDTIILLYVCFHIIQQYIIYEFVFFTNFLSPFYVLLHAFVLDWLESNQLPIRYERTALTNELQSNMAESLRIERNWQLLEGRLFPEVNLYGCESRNRT